MVITNINFGGSLQAIIGTGGGANVGMGSEGGYSLFVVFIGGLFYLGAQLAIFIAPILNIITGIINAVVGFIGWIVGINVSSLQSNVVSGFGSVVSPNLSLVYPLNLNVQGLSVFGALDVIMGSLFILSLYFMVASRGH